MKICMNIRFGMRSSYQKFHSTLIPARLFYLGKTDSFKRGITSGKPVANKAWTS